MKELEIKSLETIVLTAKEFVQFAKSRQERVYCFNGHMGAGKTTFIKSICEELGTQDTVNSPTFAIINQYDTQENGDIYHFDFYRIEDVSEALDMGALDYFDSGNFCFIEWAENVETLIPEDAIWVKIEEMENGQRKITIKK